MDDSYCNEDYLNPSSALPLSFHRICHLVACMICKTPLFDPVQTATVGSYVEGILADACMNT